MQVYQITVVGPPSITYIVQAKYGDKKDTLQIINKMNQSLPQVSVQIADELLLLHYAAS